MVYVDIHKILLVKMDWAGFIIKVLALSAVLSVAIKYGGELLPLAPTPSTAFIAVSVPALTMALVLWWRATRWNRINKNKN